MRQFVAIVSFLGLAGLARAGQAPSAVPTDAQGQPIQQEEKNEWGVNFVLEAYPGSVLFSTDIDGFETVKGNRTEKIEGFGSYIPSLNVGAALETPLLYVDTTVGGGGVANAAIISPLADAQLAVRFKLGKLFTIGPHIRGMYLWAPIWLKDNDPDFSSTWGAMGGVGFTVGIKPISLSIGLDYMGASFDAKPKDGAVPNRRELDISGVVIQVGIICRFGGPSNR